jgi:DNA modification methylase
MGKKWDGGDIAFRAETWAAVLRVLKPGAHLVAFGGTRTYHRMASAIEGAGFEVRDTLCWLYGSGFPKSHDVSKGIDRQAGAVREVIGKHAVPGYARANVEHGTQARSSFEFPEYSKEAVTDAARQWAGYGTALKPSHEDLVLAQKPFPDKHYIDMIGSALLQLWGHLWSMLSARHAAELSALSPSAFGVEFVSAQWNADALSSTRAALSAQMDMSQFESVLISSLSTVSSWAVTWAESWTPENMSTTKTELETIIDLRTLNYLVSRITAVSTILAHKSGRWSNVNALNAERCFRAVVLKLQATLELSVLVHAISKAVGNSLDVDVSPAFEPIILARKPLSERTVAANMLRWGTGAINVDGCRVSTEDTLSGSGMPPLQFNGDNHRPFHDAAEARDYNQSPLGRWPANVCTDGSDEVLAAFPDAPGQQRYVGPEHGQRDSVNCYGDYGARPPTNPRGDTGSAARFFKSCPFTDEDMQWLGGHGLKRLHYTAKADADDRLGSKHPTVKPIDLMQWLVRLVTPPKGTALDCFAGTGTTGEAAYREGFNAVLIEAEPEYQNDIRRRMALVLAGPEERQREGIKSSGKAKGHEDLPLFSTPNV